MTKEYQCIVDAAAIAGFNMPALAAGAKADIQSFSQGTETVATGKFAGADGAQHELITRATPSSNPDEPTHYFAGINVTSSTGANGRSSTSMIRNKHAFQKLISCIPSG